MAKETPTQKLKRELAEAEAQRDGYQKEASSLRKQINEPNQCYYGQLRST